MSRSFLFDAEIIGSGVYQRAVRSFFKRTIRRNQENTIEPITLISDPKIVVPSRNEVVMESRYPSIETMTWINRNTIPHIVDTSLCLGLWPLIRPRLLAPDIENA